MNESKLKELAEELVQGLVSKGYVTLSLDPKVHDALYGILLDLTLSILSSHIDQEPVGEIVSIDHANHLITAKCRSDITDQELFTKLYTRPQLKPDVVEALDKIIVEFILDNGERTDLKTSVKFTLKEVIDDVYDDMCAITDRLEECHSGYCNTESQGHCDCEPEYENSKVVGARIFNP